jgi:PadR family transcriptional regulator PadR
MELLAGTLDLIVLRLLHGGAANGWELTQRIQVLSRHALNVKEGSLYPALYRLEAQGMITGEWGTSDSNRRAKFYSLTRSGRKRLVAEQASWERFAGALELILDTN